MVGRRRNERGARLGVAEARDEVVDLVGRKLAALSRLRSLRQLDLDVLRRAQVFDCHAEAAGRDLLDCAVAVRAEPFRVFAALAGVRHRAEPVQRQRYRFVRLRRQRTERHRAADEVLHDGFGALHLVERNGGGVLEGKLRTDRNAAVEVDVVRVSLEPGIVVVADALAEVHDSLRRPQMLLAAFAEAVHPARRKFALRLRSGANVRISSHCIFLLECLSIYRASLCSFAIHAARGGIFGRLAPQNQGRTRME